MVVLAFLVFLACLSFGLPFSRPFGTATSLGVVDALALVALIRRSRSRIDDAGIVFAEMAAGFIHQGLAGEATPLVALYTVLNAGQIVVATLLVRRFAPSGFNTVAQGWRFLAVSASTFGASGGALMLLLAQPGGRHVAPGAALAYAATKLLAFVIVAPLAMGLTRDQLKRLELRSRWLEAVALAGTVSLVTAASLSASETTLLFAVSPFVLWTTFRFRLPGAATAVGLMTVLMVALTSPRLGGAAGPFTSDFAVLLILSFLALNVLTVVPVAAALDDRDALSRLAAERHATNLKINRGLTQSLLSAELAERMLGIGHWTIQSPSGEQAWSRGTYELFGRDPALGPLDFEGVIASYIPDDRTRIVEAVTRAIAERRGFDFEHGLVRADGQVRQVQAKARFAENDDGTGTLIGVTRDLTQEKEAEAARVATEASYRLLADHATDIIARVRDDVIAYISPACETVTGFRPEAFVGRSFFDFIHPDDRDGVATEIRRLFASDGRPIAKPLEYRLACIDGGWRWVASRPNVVPQGACGHRESIAVIRDITEAKIAAAGLEASEQRYRLLAETATDMIARFSLGGRIKFITPACERILGYTPDELVGMRTLDLTHPDDVPRVIETYRAYAAAGPEAAPIITCYRARHRDGRWVWLEGMPRVVFDPQTQEPIEMQDVVRDVTARHALELELIAAREAAEAGAQVKADFLANMSHELRTPLNSIVGFSGLIAKAVELLPETRRRAELVSGASRSLVAIVNDILDMSRIESEGVSLELEPVELDALLISSVDLIRDEADRKAVRLAVQILRPAGLLKLDPVRVRQVVLNLLGNALKFTDRGGRITLTLSDDPDGAVRVAVRDTGVGIAPDRLESIFGRFAQADSATSRRYGGTGLGLTICRSLVKAMGGEIGVQSTPGAGSTFWFTLPANAAVAARTARIEPEAQTPPSLASDDAPLRVLLADDNDVNRDLFRAMTLGRGLSITEASDGAEAVDRVRRDAFDVVLMDIQMPVMDGLDATRAIRALGRSELPVIALTANVLPVEIARCREAGMNDHVAKPYTAESVLETIRRWTPTAVAVGCAARPAIDDLRAAIGADFLDHFLERLAEQLRDLARLADREGCTPDQLALHTHKIRGLAGTLGLQDLARVSDELESACATPEAIADLAARSRAATETGLDEIARLRAI